MIDLYLIVVYDVEIERLDRVRMTLKRYLTWVQNSVFEGEIDDSNYASMLAEVGDIIDKDTDQIIIYRMESERAFTRRVLGIAMVDLGFVI
ncbi:MAG: CRISPR-associated endonuclease Cas2 [Candidatus Thorarchaeota archaeon]